MAVLIALLVFPWLGIWSINQLFGTSIEFTFWNWLAFCILFGLLVLGRDNLNEN